ncbi:MAG TPA: FAD-dependent oxidoreductase [Chloroflexia bacterium]|nr:FAD-dependent oxidoreductase [Chloroflexia bacterium]
MADNFDLVIVGAGSAGLVAAGFAAQLGARVALVERARVGGDCTWTGCVPSKALIRVARVAHAVRTAAQYGIGTAPPAVDMAQVRAYVRQAIAEVYQYETPETLRAAGVEVILAPGRFLDAQTLQAGDRRLTAKVFLLCTGARPVLPPIAGLAGVPYLTYEQLFDNDRLPAHLLVAGGGPLGLEMAQAYARLGAQVTVVAERLLPREEPEVAAVLEPVLAGEGIHFARARAQAVHAEGAELVVQAGPTTVRGDLLLVATGRRPVVAGLDLEKAGVAYTAQGIGVDSHLQTSVKHIYAAGDCVGGAQYTHLAGWQAFQAVRNALLPGSSAGFSDAVPAVTFTDPEVARVGCTAAAARQTHGAGVVVSRWDLAHADRAVVENDRHGFYQVVHKKDGTVLGATIVAARAGEAITELTIALQRGLKVSDLAGAIHAYPTYATPVQQLAARVAVADTLGGLTGKLLRGFARGGG